MGLCFKALSKRLVKVSRYIELQQPSKYAIAQSSQVNQITKQHNILSFLGEKGLLRWDGRWVSFLDSSIQIQLLGLSGRHMQLPQFINRVHIDPVFHATQIEVAEDGSNGK